MMDKRRMEIVEQWMERQAKPRGWGSYFYHTSSKTAVLSWSHYSDPAFDGEGQIIFGKDVDGLQWEYDDRLRQWDPEKHEEAWAAAVSACGDKRTAQRIEVYLQHYYDNPELKLVAIRSGTQQFSGYPWHAYGFDMARPMGQGGE
jgi:hypothetical protein